MICIKEVDHGLKPGRWLGLWGTGEGGEVFQGDHMSEPWC